MKPKYKGFIDPSIYPVLDFLNEQNMETFSSCSGHFITTDWKCVEYEQCFFLGGEYIIWSSAYIALKSSKSVRHLIDFFIQEGFECFLEKKTTSFHKLEAKVNWKLLFKKLKKYYREIK